MNSPLLTERMNANEQALIPRRNFVRAMTALSLWPLAQSPGRAGETNEAPAGDWPGELDSGYWPWIRQQFSIPPDEAYFNTGTLGACPARSSTL